VPKDSKLFGIVAFVVNNDSNLISGQTFQEHVLSYGPPYRLFPGGNSGNDDINLISSHDSEVANLYSKICLDENGEKIDFLVSVVVEQLSVDSADERDDDYEDDKVDVSEEGDDDYEDESVDVSEEQGDDLDIIPIIEKQSAMMRASGAVSFHLYLDDLESTGEISPLVDEESGKSFVDHGSKGWPFLLELLIESQIFTVMMEYLQVDDYDKVFFIEDPEEMFMQWLFQGGHLPCFATHFCNISFSTSVDAVTNSNAVLYDPIIIDHRRLINLTFMKIMDAPAASDNNISKEQMKIYFEDIGIPESLNLFSKEKTSLSKLCREWKLEINMFTSTTLAGQISKMCELNALAVRFHYSKDLAFQMNDLFKKVIEGKKVKKRKHNGDLIGYAIPINLIIELASLWKELLAANVLAIVKGYLKVDSFDEIDYVDAGIIETPRNYCQNQPMHHDICDHSGDFCTLSVDFAVDRNASPTFVPMRTVVVPSSSGINIKEALKKINSSEKQKAKNHLSLFPPRQVCDNTCNSILYDPAVGHGAGSNHSTECRRVFNMTLMKSPQKGAKSLYIENYSQLNSKQQRNLRSILEECGCINTGGKIL